MKEKETSNKDIEYNDDDVEFLESSRKFKFSNVDLSLFEAYEETKFLFNKEFYERILTNLKVENFYLQRFNEIFFAKFF